MGNNHVKRLAAPKTWQIQKKHHKFVTKAAPGPHALENAMPLGTLLKEVMGFANTSKEAKKIVGANEVKIDGRARKDLSFPVGIFDTIEFGSIKECFRVLFNTKGRIEIVRIKKEESLMKPCKIVGKHMVNGKFQLNLYDGKNIMVESGAYKVGDTVILSLPELKISKHLKLGKNAAIFLTGGKHIGETGNVEDIIKGKVTYKNSRGDLIETSKDYAFVIGDAKPLITIA